MGGLAVAGSRVGTDDMMHGMAVRSGEDVEVAAGAGSDVMVSGGAVGITAVKNVDVSAASIGLSTEWGGSVVVAPHGGAMAVEALRLSGAELGSEDRLGGLAVRSAEEDIELAAGRTVAVHGQDVRLVAEQDIEVAGRSVELIARGYNENVEVQTSGGALTVGKLGFSGSVMASRDAMSGLRLRSAEDVELAAGADRNIMMSGADVVVAAQDTMKVEAAHIELAAAWNGDVSVGLAGGAMAAGSVRVSGSGVESHDAMLGLRLSSARDIELLPGVGHDVVVASGGLLVSTEGTTSISSRSIAMSVSWNEDVRMMPKGGAVQAGPVRMSGGSIVSGDTLEGLSVRSGEDVVVSAGPGKDVMVSGGSVMLSSARQTSITGQQIEMAAGWNREISMDAGLAAPGPVRILLLEHVAVGAAAPLRPLFRVVVLLLPAPIGAPATSILGVGVGVGVGVRVAGRRGVNRGSSVDRTACTLLLQVGRRWRCDTTGPPGGHRQGGVRR